MKETEYVVEEWILEAEPKYRYMLLDRMRQDCVYFLRDGVGGNPENLCAGNVGQQIAEMKALWNSFPENDKPEWLTWEEILEFESRMR